MLNYLKVASSGENISFYLLELNKNLQHHEMRGHFSVTPTIGISNSIILHKYAISDQLNEIYQTTLSGIICRNSDAVEYSQTYVMRKIGEGNEIVNCKQLDRFDFNPWKDLNAGSSSSQPKFEKINFIKIATDQMKVLIANDQDNDNVNRTPVIL